MVGWKRDAIRQQRKRRAFVFASVFVFIETDAMGKRCSESNRSVENARQRRERKQKVICETSSVAIGQHPQIQGAVPDWVRWLVTHALRQVRIK